MSIADLRAKALSFNRTLEETYTVCLDPSTRAIIANLEADLAVAKTRLMESQSAPQESERASKRRSIGEAVSAQEKGVADAEEALHKALLEADDDDFVRLVFGKLSVNPLAYSELRKEFTAKDGETDHIAMAAALRERCYRRCENLAGEDLGISWGEATDGFLSPTDLGDIADLLVVMHLSSARVPFDRRISGKRT